MTRPARRPQLLLLLLVALRCCRAVQNDATETTDSPLTDKPQEEPGDAAAETHDEPGDGAVNRARNGGRRLGDTERNGPEQSQMGCRELRSTKYISDGQCTSINPIKELVCAGECLPAHLLPNWIGGGGYTGRYWSRREAQEWRCVIDRTRSQRIRLQCQDGSSRTYKITVVTSCKCKRYSRQQNDSGHESEVQGKSQTVHGAKRRKGQRKTGTPKDRAGMQSVN